MAMCKVNCGERNCNKINNFMPILAPFEVCCAMNRTRQPQINQTLNELISNLGHLAI